MIYNQDCTQGMKDHVGDNTIDLVFTDPPYGIKGDKLDSHYNRASDKVVGGYCEVNQADYDDFSQQWISQAARCLRPGGSIYIVSGYTNLHHVLNALHTTNLKEVNHIIAEYSFGVYTKHKWVSSHYHVLFWTKPGKRTFNQQYADTKTSYHDRLSVQKLPRDYQTGQKRYQNALSETFIDKFINYSSNAGDTVMDPFSGSFTTQRSAERLGRQFVGFEKNAEAVNEFANKAPALAYE